MFRTFIAAAAAVLVVPAAAQAQVDATQGAFSYKGVEYTYTAEKVGDVKVVKGTADGKEPFELRIKGRTVAGKFGDKPVKFNLSDVERIKVATR